MTEFNYCPKCGEELVEGAGFCHSCGVSLSELANNTSSNDGGEQNNSIDGFEHIDEATMDSIDFDPYSPTDGEDWEKMEEQIAKVVEEYGLTIDHITADDIFNYIITDKIFERSAQIKIEEANQKSPDISTIQAEMDKEN
jgi:hypothetical protein